MGTTVTFGELMLRLSPPGVERILQTPCFQATFGGGEANVAVSLALFGTHSTYVTILPDNPVSNAAVAELRRMGVDTQHILRRSGRMGVYYLEQGAGQRGSRVIYDREHSAIAVAPPDAIDWSRVLDNASWLHITGITPALSESAMSLTLNGVRAARARNITISCDLNYRKNLWKWGKAAREVMPQFVQLADVLIANEEDIQLTLGIGGGSAVEGGSLDSTHYERLTGMVSAEFAQLRMIAVTLRESYSASHNGWSACLRNGQAFHLSRRYEILPIEDRVGAGDSFAAGLIFGLQQYRSEPEALEFAVAASCLKHTIPGDFNRVTIEEVRSLLESGGSGRVQR